MASTSSRRSIFGGARRRQAHQRKVGRAAADVGDQHQLFALQRRFIGEGGGDRFELEGDIRESRAARDFFQGALGQLVGSGIFIHEKHRAAEHGLREIAAGSLFGALLERADELRQQVAVAQRTPQHLGLAIDQRRAEQALERAHQPAFAAFQVSRQRRAAEMDGIFLGVEEYRRGQGGLAAFQRQQGSLAGTAPADGGVGRAEVHAACVSHGDLLSTGN